MEQVGTIPMTDCEAGSFEMIERSPELYAMKRDKAVLGGLYAGMHSSLGEAVYAQRMEENS
jgi:hypothetical protein